MEHILVDVLPLFVPGSKSINNEFLNLLPVIYQHIIQALKVRLYQISKTLCRPLSVNTPSKVVVGNEIKRILPVPLWLIVENLIRGWKESTVDKVDDPFYATGESICTAVEQMHDSLVCLSNPNNEDVGGLGEIDIVVP